MNKREIDENKINQIESEDWKMFPLTHKVDRNSFKDCIAFNFVTQPGAPNENIVQNHLKIALLNRF